MIYLRPSGIDLYQRYLNNQLEIDEFIEQIKTKANNESFALEFGTYIHKLLLENIDNDSKLIAYDYHIDNDFKKSIIQSFDEILNNESIKYFVSEVSQETQYFKSDSFYIKGTIDGIYANYGFDIKNVTDTYSFYHNSTHSDFYRNSWQGKLYMWLFNLDKFSYFLFCYDKDRTELLTTEIVTISKYNGIEKDCIEILKSYANFIKHFGLEEYYCEQ